MTTGEVTIVWLRRDFRLHDNRTIHKAIQSGKAVLCLFIFDEEILLKISDKFDSRVNFIHNELSRLKKELNRYGSDLLVYQGKVLEQWSKVIEQYNITEVFLGEDYEPYAIQRDRQVQKFLLSKRIGFHTIKDQTIFAPEEIRKDDGSPYTIFTPYYKKWRLRFEMEFTQPVRINYRGKFLSLTNPLPFPTLENLGFSPSTIRIPSRDFSRFPFEQYENRRDWPARSDGTSGLGIHLRFGTISIRELAGMAHKRSEVFLSELAWREFFMMILREHPRTVSHPFRSEFEKFPWKKSPSLFEKWKEGKTGYPLVDAGMRELKATGRMHNRVRMVTASFLTKHLLIHWKKGEEWFASHLLDYELSSNVGNWQWAAGSGCDAAPYFRIFNPERQLERFDPKREYVRKWIPELETPEYPKPIVDHSLARARALESYKSLRKES